MGKEEEEEECITIGKWSTTRCHVVSAGVGVGVGGVYSGGESFNQWGDFIKAKLPSPHSYGA